MFVSLAFRAACHCCPQGFGGLDLTPRKVDSLLRTTLPVKGLFQDSIWPQLEAQGWAKDSVGRGGGTFYPPQPAPSSRAEASGLESIQEVLHYLQRYPEHLPPAPVPQPAAAQRLAAGGRTVCAQQHLQEAPVRAPPPQPRGFASVGSGKVCENCGTTSTPLWRKDRTCNMMMCNACGICESLWHPAAVGSAVLSCVGDTDAAWACLA